MPQFDGKPSKGQVRIRPGFNVSQVYEVDVVKESCAQHIDELDKLVELGGEAGRCAELAQNRFEEAAMWATKAFTAEVTPAVSLPPLAEVDAK